MKSRDGKSQRREEKKRREEKRSEAKRREEKRREEKRREEKRRTKKIKKRKSQKIEDGGARKGGQVTKHWVFPMICGSGGSKSRLAKAAGAEPAGQMRDEKLHAVVARSTFQDPMLQNATSLRKSAPGPPNSSDEHVFCTAPATENASLQILFKCPMPAIGLNATKPSRFAHF